MVVVVPGDTLSGIAERYGVRLADLVAANRQVHDPSLIRVGGRITIPTALVNQLVEGTHDGASASDALTRQDCYANGWASDPNDRTKDVAVRLLVDGRVRLAVVANQYRQDLAEAIGGDGTAGFQIDLAPLLTPKVAHEIRVQAQDLQTRAWVDLNLTPRGLRCAVTDVATPPAP